MDTKFAPYAPPSAVLGVIRHYRQRDVPERVSSVNLQQIGVTESLTARTLAALKFLELIREDGTTTDQFRALRFASEDDYQDVIGRVIDASYRDVLDHVDLSTATERDINNAFIPFSPGGQRDRMILLFIALAKEAGWEVAAQPKTAAATRKPNQRPKAKTTGKPAVGATKSDVRATTRGQNVDPTGASLLFGVTEADIAALEDDEFAEVWAALGKVARARSRGTPTAHSSRDQEDAPTESE